MNLLDMIKTEMKYGNLYRSQVGNKTGGYSWIDKTAIMASITQKGIEAVDKEESKGSQQRIDESIISTNASIEETNRLTQESIKFQTNVAKWSLRLTGISILLIGLTAYLQYQDKTDKEVEKLRLQLEKSENNQKEILLSLKEINSSIEKNKIDSVSVRMRPQK